MATSRSGTVLLFAIGLVALAAVLSLGFLRSVTLQRNAGHATTIYLLAMEAARAGTSHAIEQIGRDYAANAVTRMDGPARAPFRAHFKPFDMVESGNNVRDNRVINLHDTSSEDYIHNPAWTELFWGSYMNQGQAGSGSNTTDGRGRWIEPELYAASSPVPVTANGSTYSLPSAPVRFGDDDGEESAGSGNWQDGTFNAVGVSVNRSGNPDAMLDVRSILLNAGNGSRCAPILYDKDFHRLAYATRAEALSARQQARYRLRYAVMVRDLDGFLLLNPDPSLDWKRIVKPDPQDSSYASDPVHQRIIRYMHACQNLMMGLAGFNDGGGNDTLGQRFAHVFAGRGWTTNYLRNSDADPWPRTWPLMYRMSGGDFWWLFRSGGWSGDPSPNPCPFIADQLYNRPGGPTGIADGREPLVPGSGPPWRSGNLGPQYSPLLATKTLGSNALDVRFDAQGSPYAMSILGRGQSGQGSGRYGGVVDTPWSVNVLTAPPSLLNALATAYLPAGVIQENDVAKPPGPVPNGGNANDYALDPASTTRWEATRGIFDLFNTSHSPAFEHYSPPSRTTPSVIPDYHQASVLPAESGYRYPQERYPGPLCFNGVDPVSGSVVHDTYGTLIDIAEQGSWASDPHTGWVCAGPRQWINPPNGVAVKPPSDQDWSARNGPGDSDKDVPSGSGPGYSQVKWWNRWSRDYASHWVRPHTESYWSDILYAFNEAITLARCRTASYEGNAYVPRSGDAIQSDPTLVCTSIADLDNLFIRCLGHDPDNPGSPPPANLCWRKAWERFTPQNNLYTLKAMLAPRTVRTYDASGGRPDMSKPIDTVCDGAIQTQVLELMVNDFRFSMFGSHPSYAATFRPLDFNGDGMVAFSGYKSDRQPATTQDAIRKSMLIDQDCIADANGRGDWVGGSGSVTDFQSAGITPFCLIGNLWIGRSRFWNIMVRGEVYDNLAKQAIGQSNLETSLIVDPAQEADRPAPNPSRLYSTQVVYQHWYFNKYQGLMQRNF